MKIAPTDLALKLARKPGSENRIFWDYRKGRKPVSDAALSALEELESAVGIKHQRPESAVGEQPATYGATPRDMRINPRFALNPASPTRGDVEAYVAAYLDLCSQLPGGWGFAYNEVLSALPMDKVKRLLQQQTNNPHSP